VSTKANGNGEATSGARISPATWVLVTVVAGTLLLLHTGYTTGEWRGAVVTEVQVLAVGLVTWLVLRSAED
jgi:hypothetical protein